MVFTINIIIEILFPLTDTDAIFFLKTRNAILHRAYQDAACRLPSTNSQHSTLLISILNESLLSTLKDTLLTS